MRNKIRWFSIIIILEIILTFISTWKTISPIVSENILSLCFTIPIFLIGISFLIFLIFTFINNQTSDSVLSTMFKKNKAFLVVSLVIISFLLLCSIFIFITVDISYSRFSTLLAGILEPQTFGNLFPYAILGYALFWEILILFSFTRDEFKGKPKYWIGLPIFLAVNYLYWSELVNVGKYLEPYLAKVYAKEVEVIFSNYHWWELLLPIKELRGFWQYIIILTHYMENIIGISGVWHLNQLFLILVSFFLSWKVFRSEIFSYFLSICLVMGTHFYHAFQYSSITGFYLLHALYLLLMYFGYEYIRREKGSVIFLIVSIPVLIFSAVLMEGWLDFFASVWVILIFLFILFQKRNLHQLSRRVIPLFFLYNFVAIVYVYIDFTYIKFPHTTGESAVVFAYGTDYFWRIVDDLISNYITYLYTTLTNFLPPGLITSNALYEYFGELQEKKNLIYNHYLFFWRYAAGALTVAFFYFFVKVIKKTFKEESFSKYLPLAIFLIMVAVNSPTHTIVQIRGFKTMPLLGYQVQQGILGLSLSIAYLMHLIQLRIRNKKAIILISLGVFLIILYTSIHKPNYLWHMIRVTGLEQQGPYPLPLNSVIDLIHTFLKI